MSEGVACYRLEAWDAAQALCRILGLSAQQGATLASLTACGEDDRVSAELRLTGLDVRRAAMLAEKIRALVAVDNVDFSFASAPGGGLRGAQDAQHIAAGHLADVLR